MDEDNVVNVVNVVNEVGEVDEAANVGEIIDVHKIGEFDELDEFDVGSSSTRSISLVDKAPEDEIGGVNTSLSRRNKVGRRDYLEVRGYQGNSAALE